MSTRATETSIAEEFLLKVNTLRFALGTVSLPALSLLFCFVSCIIFRFEEVNETVCEVQNVIPSISAVTGITPQAYVWRICIALHAAPRYAVGIMYYNQNRKLIKNIAEKDRGRYLKLLSLNYWLYTIENSCLVAVSYISNRENYPLHEKIFTVFMFASVAYMLLNTILFKWNRGEQMTDIEKKSYKWKKITFCWIAVSTASLIFFFIRHRVFCIPNAFSWFSLSEYFIAYANMGYHLTGYYDFYGISICAARFVQQPEPQPQLSNGTVYNTRSKTKKTE